MNKEQKEKILLILMGQTTDEPDVNSNMDVSWPISLEEDIDGANFGITGEVTAKFVEEGDNFLTPKLYSYSDYYVDVTVETYEDGETIEYKIQERIEL